MLRDCSVVLVLGVRVTAVGGGHNNPMQLVAPLVHLAALIWIPPWDLFTESSAVSAAWDLGFRGSVLGLRVWGLLVGCLEYLVCSLMGLTWI